MRRRIASGTAAVCGAALLLAMTVTLGGVFGLFSSTNANPSNNFTTAPDYAAPTAGRSVIGRPRAARRASSIRAAPTWSMRTSPTRATQRAAIAAVTSNTSAVTTGGSSTSLSAGAFSVGGLSYSHRANSLTANASVAEGTYSYTLGLSDNAGNSRSQSGFQRGRGQHGAERLRCADGQRRRGHGRTGGVGRHDRLHVLRTTGSEFDPLRLERLADRREPSGS